MQPLERTTADLIRIVSYGWGETFALSQGRLRLLGRNSLARSGVVARVLDQVFIHIFAGDLHGMWILPVMTNLALGLGCRSLPWNLRNQNKNEGERN
jgi:hypothetical protein